jgi:hypothetical protein
MMPDDGLPGGATAKPAGDHLDGSLFLAVEVFIGTMLRILAGHASA